MVVLNQKLQIIDNSMEESIVVRNRGGGCIVKKPPLFSPDGKCVYLLCGWCVSGYSVQTGECTHQFTSENKEEIVSSAIYRQSLLSVTSAGVLTVWRTSEKTQDRKLTLKLDKVDCSEKCMTLEGRNSAVVELHPVSSQIKGKDFDLVVVIREKEDKDLQVWLMSGSDGRLITNLYVRAQDKPHSVSACDEFVAVINKDRITVVPLVKDGEKISCLAGMGRSWTVVVVAPGGRGMAAGDDTGRVVYWAQPYQLQTKALFHWHTLPVNAVTFSASGSYMYSGGGEGVMVRWNVEVSNVRNFLPRLPAPVLHLTVSPDNQYVAIATEDNGIQLADGQNRVSCVIQKLTWGVTAVPGTQIFPAGLNWDPRSRSIVLNGRPGHLQFFNTDSNKMLFNLDITGQNYLTQERHKVVMNAEVTHVAMSHDGKWMVTVETRDDQDTYLETLLKFWQYKFNARQFSLNTCIQLPHKGRVNKIKFQPPGTLPDHYMLVTTGTDCKFRIWTPSLSESIHSEGLRWICDSVGFYRTLPAECVAFSADGSILGVTFGHSLTLWDSETCQLNTSLTRDNAALRALEFGSHECCHLVVAASDSQLNVWSILTLYVVWTVPVRTAVLCADPLSSNMAVFTADNSVFVFSPSSPKLLYEKKNLSTEASSRVISAIFVPRSHKLLDTNVAWCSDSQLHFITSNQELQYLELESEPDPGQSQTSLISTAAPITPFSILTAQQSTSKVEKTQVTHDQLGTARDVAVRKLVKNPAHTMPHIHLFCSSFLKALAITRETGERNKQKVSSKVTRMEVDEASDSDAAYKPEKVQILSKRKKPRKKYNKKKNGNPEENNDDQPSREEDKETPSKNKHRKANKERSSPKKKESSFLFEDLNEDWLSVLENR